MGAGVEPPDEEPQEERPQQTTKTTKKEVASVKRAPSVYDELGVAQAERWDPSWMVPFQRITLSTVSTEIVFNEATTDELRLLSNAHGPALFVYHSFMFGSTPRPDTLGVRIRNVLLTLAKMDWLGPPVKQQFALVKGTDADDAPAYLRSSQWLARLREENRAYFVRPLDDAKYVEPAALGRVLVSLLLGRKPAKPFAPGQIASLIAQMVRWNVSAYDKAERWHGFLMLEAALNGTRMAVKAPPPVPPPPDVATITKGEAELELLLLGTDRTSAGLELRHETLVDACCQPPATATAATERMRAALFYKFCVQGLRFSSREFDVDEAIAEVNVEMSSYGIKAYMQTILPGWYRALLQKEASRDHLKPFAGQLILTGSTALHEAPVGSADDWSYHVGHSWLNAWAHAVKANRYECAKAFHKLARVADDEVAVVRTGLRTTLEKIAERRVHIDQDENVLVDAAHDDLGDFSERWQFCVDPLHPSMLNVRRGCNGLGEELELVRMLLRREPRGAPKRTLEMGPPRPLPNPTDAGATVLGSQLGAQRKWSTTALADYDRVLAMADGLLVVYDGLSKLSQRDDLRALLDQHVLQIAPFARWSTFARGGYSP